MLMFPFSITYLSKHLLDCNNLLSRDLNDLHSCIHHFGTGKVENNSVVTVR